MWRTNEYGEASPELSFVYEATQASAMIGIIYGSVTESRKPGKLNIFSHTHIFYIPVYVPSQIFGLINHQFIKLFW